LKAMDSVASPISVPRKSLAAVCFVAAFGVIGSAGLFAWAGPERQRLAALGLLVATAILLLAGLLAAFGWVPSVAHRKSFAAVCFATGLGLIGSLNLLLPRTLEDRHLIGCGLMIFAAVAGLLGLAALFGERIIAAVVAKCRPWSMTKRIVVGATLYVVIGLLCHLSVALYDVVLRRWADLYLPESIAWWFQ
jgi:hypothetical protein